MAIVAFLTGLMVSHGANAEVMSESNGLKWQRYGVVMELGQAGDKDERGLESPIVLRVSDDQLIMWYRGRTFDDENGRVMRAVSSDGLNWDRLGVVMEPEEEYEGNKIDPMTIVWDNDHYKMWYGGNAKGGSANLAISTDGIHWERSRRNPVLSKTSGNWDRAGAGGQHSIFRANDRWEMIYKGYGRRDGWTYYGLATSSDGEKWRKRGLRIEPKPEIGESTLFRNPFAFFHDGRYFVIHAMAGRENLSLRALYSDDGKNWVRSGVVFKKGLDPDGYDVKWATSCNIIIENGLVRMWYEGGDKDGKVRLLYAETDEQKFFDYILRDLADE